MRRHFWAGILPVIGLIVGLGCRSTSSTFLSRFDNDHVAGNSNGEPGYHNNAKPYKGIPVTMKVLTHVNIAIHEKIFLDPVTLEQIQTDRRHLEANADEVFSDMIFAVDPKRAASGNTTYTFDMNNGSGDARGRQYFKQIKQKVEDETIKDISAALGGLLPLLSKKPETGSQAASRSSELGMTTACPIEMDRVVAWKCFDINSVDFEEQVRQFVDHHMNSCNSCCQNTTLSPVGAGEQASQYLGN